MCGRYTLTHELDALVECFGFTAPETELNPRYNIAPGQEAPVVVWDPEGGGGIGARRLRLMRWGLVPFWARDASIGARMINARAETAAEKPAFRQAMRRRRCLIPASAFYEWRKQPEGKQPYAIRFRDRRPFAFAGLWERWEPAGDEPLESCTILTTAPNALVEPLHDRMPVILDPSRYDDWLASGELATELREGLLVPHPPSDMEAFPVSRRVSNPANDDPACLEPASDLRPPAG